MERSVRYERRPWMFEVHTVKEEGGEEALGAGEGSNKRGGRRQLRISRGGVMRWRREGSGRRKLCG